MAPKVTIVDYGLGNMLSVSRAFEFSGAEVEVADTQEKIVMAERLVLPGVGAFADGMQGLRQRDIVQALKQYAGTGRPFLGICLGMQLMMDCSLEFGLHTGLGLIPGKVVPVPATGMDGTPHKIPHIGWNALIPAAPWTDTLLAAAAPGDAVYFVHSFACDPGHPSHRLADVLYDGCVISAVIKAGNLYGCQFHPEKSGPVGQKMLRNFLTLPDREPPCDCHFAKTT